MRLSVAIAVSCLLITTLCAGEHAVAAIRKQTNIASQGLGPALKELAKDHEFQILYRTELVGERRTAGAIGELTLDEALHKLLSGTNLTFQYLDDKTITILPMSAGASTNPPPGTATFAPDATSSETTASQRERSFRHRLAQAEPSTTMRDPQSSQVFSTDRDNIAEIVVTAQKQEQRLFDVPAPVSVLSATSLIESNQVQLQDFYAKVPGLSLTTAGYHGGSIVSIRGIASGLFNDGTTGVVIDDIPFGNSAATGPTEIVPEIEPADLTRIEVLRGPQGTLYGASSMGGLLKYVTVGPSLDESSGTLRAGANFVEDGEDAGYNVYGAANVPLGDTVAVRASAYTRKIPGYIDDPLHGLEDVNDGRISGARAALLWQPSTAFSAKFGVLLQETDLNGNDYAVAIPALDLTADDLSQNSPPGSGGTQRKLQLYTATLTGEVGAAEITALSAYSRNQATFYGDYSPLYGAFASTQFPGYAGVVSILEYETERFSQELRLSMPLTDQLQWLVGAFYNHEDVPQDQYLIAIDPVTGARSGSIGVLEFPSRYEEQALFTQLTYAFTKNFDVQLGGRYSEDRQRLIQTNSGSLLGGTTAIPAIRSEGDAFTYLLSPRWKVTPALTVYARIASGYRPGGPNTNALSGINPSWDADTTNNYEIGAKGLLFDQRLTFDVSVYHIDWEDMVITLQNPAPPSLRYKDNAGEALSEGVELALELRPGAGFQLSATGTWSRAELAEDFPPTSTGALGREGDRLPFSPRRSGSLSVNQDISLPNGWEAMWGVSLSYVGDRAGPFTAPSLAGRRERFDSYSKVDARVGVRVADWALSLYVNNLTDERGLVNGGLGAFIPVFYNFIPPRSAGLTLQKDF